MSTDLVHIDPAEYGLEKSEAKTVEQAFKPMLEKMTELEDQFNEVVSMEISPDTCEKARRLRLDYVKIRTGTAKIHKKAKAYYLAGSRFVDGWKNAQLFASQEKEEKLREIEEHYERIEEERKAKLAEERAAALEPYDVSPDGLDLGEMKDDVWENFLAGTKMRHEQRLEAERKAEEERKRKEEEEKERLRLQAEENKRLRAEAEKREKELAEERRKAEEARKKAEAEQKAAEEKARKEREAAEAKARKEREAAEAKARAEREAAEAKAKKEREEAEAKLKAEREERERIQKELEAKRKEEEEAEAARLAAEEAEKAKGEEDRFVDFVSDLDALTTKYTFKSKTYKSAHEKAVAGIRRILEDIEELAAEVA